LPRRADPDVVGVGATEGVFGRKPINRAGFVVSGRRSVVRPPVCLCGGAVHLPVAARSVGRPVAEAIQSARFNCVVERRRRRSLMNETASVVSTTSNDDDNEICLTADDIRSSRPTY